MYFEEEEDLYLCNESNSKQFGFKTKEKSMREVGERKLHMRREKMIIKFDFI